MYSLSALISSGEPTEKPSLCVPQTSKSYSAESATARSSEGCTSGTEKVVLGPPGEDEGEGTVMSRVPLARLMIGWMRIILGIVRAVRNLCVFSSTIIHWRSYCEEEDQYVRTVVLLVVAQKLEESKRGKELKGKGKAGWLLPILRALLRRCQPRRDQYL